MQELLPIVFGFLLGAIIGWFLHSSMYSITKLTGSLFPIRELSPEQKKELFHLFHTVWTKAVGTQDYVKREWTELSGLLSMAEVLENP